MNINVAITKHVRIGKFYGSFTGACNFTDSYDDMTELFTTIWKECRTNHIEQIDFAEHACDEYFAARMIPDFRDNKPIFKGILFLSDNNIDNKEYPFTKKGVTDCVKAIVEFMRNR